MKVSKAVAILDYIKKKESNQQRTGREVRALGQDRVQTRRRSLELLPNIHGEGTERRLLLVRKGGGSMTAFWGAFFGAIMGFLLFGIMCAFINNKEE